MMKFQKSLILCHLLILLALSGYGMARRFKQPCKVDADCKLYYGSAYQCSIQDKTCRHELNFPFKSKIEFMEAIGFISVILASALANAGGVGGGGILAPIYIFLFGYTIQESIPLTKATILAGAIVNIFVIIRKRHPHKVNEFLIDFGLSSIILPMLLSGTMIGVIMTQMLPPLLTLTILTLYLVQTSFQMYGK